MDVGAAGPSGRGLIRWPAAKFWLPGHNKNMRKQTNCLYAASESRRFSLAKNMIRCCVCSEPDPDTADKIRETVAWRISVGRKRSFSSVRPTCTALVIPLSITVEGKWTAPKLKKAESKCVTLHLPFTLFYLGIEALKTSTDRRTHRAGRSRDGRDPVESASAPPRATWPLMSPSRLRIRRLTTDLSDYRGKRRDH
jgi:hypothetical protein